MQQAYRMLRVVAEAQTIRLVLTLTPNELLLKELVTACTSLIGQSSIGVKAIVLDFNAGTQPIALDANTGAPAADIITEACTAVRVIEQPVLAVVRGTLSIAASKLVHTSDLILVAHDALLMVPFAKAGKDETLSGKQIVRQGLATWSVPMNDIDNQVERALDILRGKSAIALRYTKASVRLGSASLTDQATRLEALKRVNTFYLTELMHTADASEGLHAFLEKRKAHWKNR